jgi:hypothetical protein
MACPRSASDQQKVGMALEVLRTQGRVRFAARGYSMLPSLWPGDVVTVEAQSTDQFQSGDLLLYVREERFFLHRMLRNEECGVEARWLMRGDSMPHADQPVSAHQIVGKVVEVERDGRRLPGIPRCTLPVRAAGFLLCWDRLRSVVLRLRESRHTRPDASPVTSISI